MMFTDHSISTTFAEPSKPPDITVSPPPSHAFQLASPSIQIQTQTITINQARAPYIIHSPSPICNSKNPKQQPSRPNHHNPNHPFTISLTQTLLPSLSHHSPHLNQTGLTLTMSFPLCLVCNSSTSKPILQAANLQSLSFIRNHHHQTSFLHNLMVCPHPCPPSSCNSIQPLIPFLSIITKPRHHHHAYPSSKFHNHHRCHQISKSAPDQHPIKQRRTGLLCHHLQFNETTAQPAPLFTATHRFAENLSRYTTKQSAP
jgi:hypothetical protein